MSRTVSREGSNVLRGSSALTTLDPLDEGYEAQAINSEALSSRRTVLRNTLFLTVGQIVGVPLSMLANAVTARYLGPAGFGYMYLGTTFNSFGFLVVEWGQGGVLPALVAEDRAQAGALLGTSVVWRLIAALLMYPILLGLSHILGYSSDVGIVISLLFVGYTVSAVSNAGQWVMVGFERADVGAYRQMLEQAAVLAVVVPILMLGGKLHAALVGHAIVTLLVLVYIGYALRSAHIARFSLNTETLKTLLSRGTPFVFMSLAMTLQPGIDATFLSKLASADVVGWHSAARRLIGFLIFPASALIGALYPTLCRLHTTDPDAFKRTTSVALRGTSLLVIPVALGCLLYPDIGIAFYDRSLFFQAENNVRVLSLFVLLLYFTMPIGICILASGRQRAWTIVQSSCVVVSLVLDPLLVPWFQRRTGNGGLGVCVATVVSEVIVLVCGIWLAPRGLFDGRFWRSLGPALASGGAMLATAYLLRAASPFLAAPVAVSAYGACLWLTGGVDANLVQELRSFFASRLSRLRAR
jgi:O-antigen/teichoic acid export membrane protein